MVTQSIPSLSVKENQAVEELKNRLVKELKGKMVFIKLFGSKVRGSFNKYSDIDILIVYKGNGKKAVESKILDIEWDVIKKYQYAVYPSIITYSLQDYKKDLKLQTPFIYNVNKEGVEIWNISLKKSS